MSVAHSWLGMSNMIRNIRREWRSNEHQYPRKDIRYLPEINGGTNVTNKMLRLQNNMLKIPHLGIHHISGGVKIHTPSKDIQLNADEEIKQTNCCHCTNCASKT